VHVAQQLAERHAFSFQVAVQRPRIHRQAVRCRFQLEIAEQDAGAKDPDDLVGDIGQNNRPVFRDRCFQDRALAGIGAGHRTFELAGGGDEGRLLSVEPDGDPKELAIRLNIGWGVRDKSTSSGEAPHNSRKSDGDRSITELVDAIGSPSPPRT